MRISCRSSSQLFAFALVICGIGACGSTAQGTAAAPAGSTVLVYRAADADELERVILAHNVALLEAMRLSEQSATLQRAVALSDSMLSPAPRAGARDIDAIGRGTVGVGGALAVSGRFRGRVALVIEAIGRPVGGCRVDVEMPAFGTRTITLAGDQCRPWGSPMDPADVGRAVSMRWREDSLAAIDRARLGRARAELQQYYEAAEDIPEEIIGAKNGDTFFRYGCSAAEKIPLSERVYFGTRGEAKRAGYHKSTVKGC